MTIHSDITIIGAGLVGMTAACALAKLGLDVVVIDSADLDVERKKESDGRTCAIAAGSADIFKEIGVWDDMQLHAGEIRDIRVTDGNSPIFLHYDHAIVGDRPMGYIIENFYLREALFRKSNDEGRITILAPARYTDIKFGDDECVVKVTIPSPACGGGLGRGPATEIAASLPPLLTSPRKREEEHTIHSQLIIAADGKNSNVRKIAGIRTNEWKYNQSGIVCTIAHDRHHQFTAQERFLPQGPFAVLPMHGGYHSSLVWTEKNEVAPVYMSMEKAEIEEQITLRTGEYLGKITLASRMYSYPLSLCKAKKYTGKRLALIGDAAHAMHPLAGQGFNVGIRDVAELVKRFSNKKKGGTWNLEPETLRQYEAARMADSIALLAITDILNRAFSNNIFPLRTLRRLGMAAVNHATPLKKFFMKHAMGETS